MQEEEFRSGEEESITREEEYEIREDDSRGREEESERREEKSRTGKEEYRSREEESITRKDESRSREDESRSRDEESRSREEESRSKDEESRTWEEESITSEEESRSLEEESRTMEEDSINECDNDEQLCKKAKKKISFRIPFVDWSGKVIIKTDKRGDRHLGGEWTNVFLTEIEKKNHTCPLIFKANRVKRENLRETNAPFFRGKAQCMFPGCVRYILEIRKLRQDEQDVKVKVRTIPPYTEIKHQKCRTKGRPISGTERKKVAAELLNDSPSTVYYERLGNVPNTNYDAGNTSHIGNKKVLQKIASEATVAERLHRDVFVELGIQKEIYASMDEENAGGIKGCIQHIGQHPFTVHIYTAQQLAILAQEIKNNNSVLYFDATGKVVGKIPDQDKRVFYYPLVLKGREKGDPPVPVAEMISNSHNTTDIAYFWSRLFRDLHLFKPSCTLPTRVEIDFSWAFLHGILLAVNHEDTDGYLKRAWAVLHEADVWGDKTIIHICAAHLLNNVSHHVAADMKETAARKYVKHVVGLMIDCIHLDDLRYLYRQLAIILLCPTIDAHPDYPAAITNLDDSIMKQQVVHDPERDVEVNNSDAQEIPPEDQYKPGKTVFFEHFNDIRRTIIADLKAVISGEAANFLYSPKTLSYITKTYMSMAPFWTGMMLEDGKKHDTNSCAEYWMKIVKKDILQDKSRMRPGLFIRKLRANVNGRLKEYERKMNTMPNMSNTAKKKKTGNSEEFSRAQEAWGGKKRKTKGVYFKAPKSVPKPKKKESVKRVAKRALHWGGTIDLPQGTVNIDNTCTVDNMLVFLNILLDMEHVREWFTANNNIRVCRTLLEVKSLFDAGQLNEGRAVWLSEYCSPPIDESSWDIYGSEAEQFVIHLETQETLAHSRCSKRLCSRKEKTIRSTEILLGDMFDDARCASISFQQSLSEWERATEVPCSEDGRCKGTRFTETRVFAHTDPPFLVASMSYLSQARGFQADQLPDDVEIMGKKYSVFAYTVSTGSHFKGYYKANGSWFAYDGLKNPEICEVFTKQLDDIIEHVVLLKDASDPER